MRIDSGDLPSVARQVRTLLDELGATNTRIVLTGDLDEYSIAALAAAPVDGYGVGTALVTGSGAPTAALVYKLVARADTEASTGAAAPDGQALGRQARPRRAQVGGPAPRPGGSRRGRGDHPGPARAGPDDRALLHPLVRGGEIVGGEPLAKARERHRARSPSCPHALQLSRGYPAIPTVFEPNGD